LYKKSLLLFKNSFIILWEFHCAINININITINIYVHFSHIVEYKIILGPYSQNFIFFVTNAWHQ